MGFKLREFLDPSVEPEITVELSWLPQGGSYEPHVLGDQMSRHLTIPGLRIPKVFATLIRSELRRAGSSLIPVATGPYSYRLCFLERPNEMVDSIRTRLLYSGKYFELYYGDSTVPRAVRARHRVTEGVLCDTPSGPRNFNFEKIRALGNVPQGYVLTEKKLVLSPKKYSYHID